MARDGLLIDLRAALNTAKKENVPVRKEGVSIQSDVGTRDINFEVIPIRAEASQERFYVVVFQDTPPKFSSIAASRRWAAKTSPKDTPLARQHQRLCLAISQRR